MKTLTYNHINNPFILRNGNYNIEGLEKEYYYTGTLIVNQEIDEENKAFATRLELNAFELTDEELTASSRSIIITIKPYQFLVGWLNFAGKGEPDDFRFAYRYKTMSDSFINSGTECSFEQFTDFLNNGSIIVDNLEINPIEHLRDTLKLHIGLTINNKESLTTPQSIFDKFCENFRLYYQVPKNNNSNQAPNIDDSGDNEYVDDGDGK